MVEAALMTFCAFLLVMFRFGIRKIAGYATIFDVSVTALLMWLFTGTYAGMMTGIITGGMISLYLNLVRKTVGVQRLRMVRTKEQRRPTLRWVDVPPGEL